MVIPSVPRRGIPSIPREDVLAVWEQLEQARDTLADLQAIRLDLRERKEHSSDWASSAPPIEDSMTSVQWLEVRFQCLFCDVSWISPSGAWSQDKEINV